MLLYFEYLMKYYPGQKIGLIIDSAQQHVSADLHCWLQVLNKINQQNLHFTWFSLSILNFLCYHHHFKAIKCMFYIKYAPPWLHCIIIDICRQNTPSYYKYNWEYVELCLLLDVVGNEIKRIRSNERKRTLSISHFASERARIILFRPLYTITHHYILHTTTTHHYTLRSSIIWRKEKVGFDNTSR